MTERDFEANRIRSRYLRGGSYLQRGRDCRDYQTMWRRAMAQRLKIERDKKRWWVENFTAYFSDFFYWYGDAFSVVFLHWSALLFFAWVLSVVMGGV